MASRSSRAAAGLLIVNADDWGHDRATTDAIADCYRQRRISSASAMVFMEDSERAARVASELELPTGLHLNLTEPFSAESVPQPVRQRQLGAVRVFRVPQRRLRRWVYDPTIQSRTIAWINDQVTEYTTLYRIEPRHVDGHQHVHVSPNVALSRALPDGASLRNFVDFPGAEQVPRLALRSLRRRMLSMHRRSTAFFYDLRALHPILGGQHIDDVLRVSRSRPVELMVHPGRPEELELLLSESWRRTVERHALGTYDQLPAAALRTPQR